MVWGEIFVISAILVRTVKLRKTKRAGQGYRTGYLIAVRI